ncbi:MAG: hypothetical protein ABI222_10940 [Opitutaceae bacterium]
MSSLGKVADSVDAYHAHVVAEIARPHIDKTPTEKYATLASHGQSIIMEESGIFKHMMNMFGGAPKLLILEKQVEQARRNARRSQSSWMLGFVPFLDFVVKQSFLCKAMRWAGRSARGSIVQRALRRSARPPIPFTSNTKKRGQTPRFLKTAAQI